MQLALHKRLLESEISSAQPPSRMIRAGRPTDQGFCWYHRLYYRCKMEDVAEDRLLPLRVRYIDASVNWSKYSKPWDVIFGHSKAGIALFVVCEMRRDLPSELPASTARQQDQPKRRAYRPWHEPYDENYPHAELAVYMDDRRLTKERQISEEAKKEFRQIISDRSRVIRQPNA